MPVFSIERHACFERPTPLPGDVGDWLTMLAGPLVAAIESGKPRDAFVQDVRSRLVDTMQNADDSWTAPYVRLRFITR